MCIHHIIYPDFYRKTGRSYSSSNRAARPPVCKPTLIRQNAKTIRDMALFTATSNTNSTTTHCFSLAPRTVHSVMTATLFYLFLNVTGCTPADTIAPERTHSAAREDASVLSVDGFENNKTANFWRSELYTPTAGLLTGDIHRSGKKAMRFSWKPSQVNGTNDMLHSELATAALPVGDVERWYGYSSYMPSSSMANDGQTTIVSQWHGIPDPGFADSVPPIEISVEPGNKLRLIYRASNKPITKPLQHPTSQIFKDLGPAMFDQWVDYVVHAKWDPTGYTGQLQVWQNGVLMVNEQNIQIGYLQQRKPFWKIGLYCWTGKSLHAEKVIYYDEARIGGPSANYESVKPGRNDGSARARQ